MVLKSIIKYKEEFKLKLNKKAIKVTLQLQIQMQSKLKVFRLIQRTDLQND